MAKILGYSVIFVLIILGANYFWPGLEQLKFNSSEPLKIFENFREGQGSLPQKIGEGANGAVKGVQTGITEYFMRKTGREIVGVLEDLPPQQQEEIKKDYCGQDPKPTP